MRAIAISEFGRTPELMDLPKPAPGPDDILVRMHAAGLNPFDWKVADGLIPDVAFPLILGVDGAGVVEEVGVAVAGFRPGDEVFGQFMRLSAGLGSYAEYALATQTSAVARMPKGMIFTQAAAVPLSTTTAYHMVEAAKVDEGQIVLVSGAGGVGQQAVQFAANAGATVIATATPDLAGFLRDLGAAQVVDFTAGPVAEQVLVLHPGGIDVVLDTVSNDPAALAALAGTVRPGGTVVTTLFSADPKALAAKEITGINLENKATPELLAMIAELIDASRIRVRIDHQVPLAEAPAALVRNREGKAKGKTVIEIS